MLQELIAKAIHADRVREVERATRDHALVQAAREARQDAESTSREPWLPGSAAARQGRTRLPA
jgi:hypothetical protein